MLDDVDIVQVMKEFISFDESRMLVFGRMWKTNKIHNMSKVRINNSWQIFFIKQNSTVLPQASTLT